MKTHAALPHGKNFQRMRCVVSRFVEQAITNASAQNHPHHAHEQDVFNIPARPGALPRDGRKWRVFQALHPEPHEEAKRSQVGQPVPVHGQRPELQGNRVDLRVDQHCQHCARAPCSDGHAKLMDLIYTLIFPWTSNPSS